MKNLIWGLFAFATLAHAQGTVTDIDGNTYDYLTYGTQQWTVENAAMETYRDGTPIPQVTDATQWSNLTTGAWCYYDNDPAKGKLYNWYAVAGIHDNAPNTPNKEFAPEGWHVPTDAEWTTLEEHLIANGYNYDGTTTGNKIAKSMASTSDWLNSTNTGAPGNNQSLNNSSNFNVLPHGYRNLNGVFYEESYDGIVWSSTVDDPTHSWNRIIYSDQNSIIRNNGYSKSGSSVRLINDNNTCSEVSINASSTEVCAGESVDLSVDGLNSSSGVNTQSHSFTTGNYTRIPYTPHLYNLPQSTIEFWYYQESSSEEFIVATEYFNTGWGFHVENNGGSPRILEWRVSNGVKLGFDIPDRYEIPFNQWIHVAGVHDGSTVYLYVDGNLIDSAPYTGQIGDSYEDIVINRHTWASGSSERLNGKIDELRISNIARYTSNFTPPLYEFNNDSNTLALWHFNGNMQDESQYNTQSVTNGTNFSSNVPFGSYNFNSTDLLWSTGDTTETISVTPTETTEYWVDVTTNGVTCREYVTINVTAPAAPTGDAEQTFCTSSTVADLTATGENIQWYDAATGGNVLDSTTALTDGQMVYASQTVNGCESTDRLEVTVSVQDITITASATEVCAGESSTLNAALTNASGTFAEGQLVNEFNHTINTNASQQFPTTVGLNYRLEIEGNVTWGTYCPALAYDPAYVLSGFYSTTEATPRDFACNDAMYSSIFCDSPGLRPIPDQYDGINHSYDYYFTANSNQISVGFFDNLLGDNCGSVLFRLFENSTPPSQNSLVWSTGDTTETITVSPTETTEYWVDVTTNGVTCREYVTINVTAPAAPTGDSEQTFCDATTVADLTATGENIQWYDAATEGNLLDTTSALTDGQTVYASQSVNGCESTDRLEVTVSIQNITITASATEVCAGESVDLSVDLNFPTICDMQINLTDIPLGQEIPGFTYGGFYNEHYYYVYNDPTSWTDGEQICRENGGYLVCINDESENTFVSNLTNNNIWIGLFRDPETCEFRWLDCIDINYTNWRPGEPNSGPCGEPYTQIIRGCSFGYNTWNNIGNNSSNGACYSNMVPIMEIDPEIYQTFDPSTTYLWSTGDTTETITVTPIETTEYWVDVTTNGVTCREYVTISVNDLPEAPTGESVNYFINCDSFSPTLDDAIATLTGDNIKLYDAAVGGNLLDPNSNIIDGQVVYASQTLDSCESSDRLEIQLNLYTLDTPVTDAPNNTVSFCNEQNLTILDLAPAQTATDRLWYETATSTTPIAETTPLVNGVTYYVSNYDIETGCESDRLAMTVEINNPEAPTGDAVQSFCDNVTVSDLSASGSNIQWYDAATGGNVLDPDSALSDGQLLYASQTENSCESVTRLEVSVEIDIIPDPILITTELEFCLAREATLADLEVDEQGFALEWYDSFSGGNMLPMDTLLEDGVSYYATLYDAASGCESLMRLEVVPTVIPCEVVIYNAISLNDNGINDHMVIENAEYFPDNSLEIYNRDGHLLYSQTQYGIGDNLFRGIANVSGIYGSTLSGDGPRLPTGSYLYVFKYFNPYEQQEYTLKGFLTINSN
jgi:uncharacterized protein (TIGR02145 family)